MALDLSQFDEEKTNSLIDSILQEENEEMREDKGDMNHSTNSSKDSESERNSGLKTHLIGESANDQVHFDGLSKKFYQISFKRFRLFPRGMILICFEFLTIVIFSYQRLWRLLMMNMTN